MAEFNQTSSSAMAERPRDACFIFDQRPALFAKLQNCIFEPPYGASGAMYDLYLKFLTQRNLLTEFCRENVSFTRKTAN